MFIVVVMFISAFNSILTTTSNVQATNSVDHVVITAVYYDTYMSYEPEEFVRIHNPTNSLVNLSGWSITDLVETISFTSGASIAPGESLFLTKNATAFNEQMAEIADYEWGVDSDPNIPQMDGTIGFANTGDEVILKDSMGGIVDVVVYGSSTYTDGVNWIGSSVPDVSEGVILERDVNETTGEYEDQNDASDWDDNRVYWVGQSHFEYETFSFIGTVTAFTSPDSSFKVITSAIENATSSFYLNIYEFHSLKLMEHVVEACKRGIDIRLFIEGTPVGVGADEKNLAKYVAQQIHNAGGQIRYMITDDAMDIHDRYTWDHAKYCIIDNDTILVMSENWKTTGIPVDNTGGNRGWGIMIENVDVADYFLMVFEDDWNIDHNDVFPYNESDPKYGAPSEEYVPSQSYPEETYTPYFDSKTVSGSFKVSPVFAPDASLLETKSILEMIKSATESVYVEQMYAHKHWGTPSEGNTTSTPDLYLEACIDAARRGCEVKILLGSAFIDYSDPRNNVETVSYVNDVAENEGLNLSARLVDAGLTGFGKIHNKGVIVDGEKTLVSSINWGKNSPTNNREVGVIIENVDIAKFYTEVFLFDWDPVNNTPGFDSDGDGYQDGVDAFPDDPSEWFDTDNDGTGNNADLDDDNDGISDDEEGILGTDPLIQDTDGDGYLDGEDYYPLDSTRWQKGEDITLYVAGAVGGVVAIVSGIYYYKKRKGRRGKKERKKK